MNSYESVRTEQSPHIFSFIAQTAFTEGQV